MNFLNIGCGRRFNEEWTNIDKMSNSKFVVKCDIEKGLPFEDNLFDVVYHSHVLEHLEVDKADMLIKECFRVLKIKGIIRVAVPDLEIIASLYLESLKKSMDGSRDSELNYDWMMLEMYDQFSRNFNGGRMASFINEAKEECIDFIRKRCGNSICGNKKNKPSGKNVEKYFLSNSKKIFSSIRELAIKKILGDEYDALKIGRFRRSGENHYWMYDRFSLKRILEKNGFVSIIQRNSVESYLETWKNFNLDTESDGTAYKPDSIYMEAVKM